MKQKWSKIKAIISEWFILTSVFILGAIILAYAIVNRESMSHLGWALLVGIILSLVIFAIALIKAMREGFAGRWMAILVLAVGLLFILYLAYNLRQIEPADWAQIMLMFALVAVALLSSMSAIRQANASVKMAVEMREQRYDMVRPVIDIERRTEAEEQIGEGFAAKEEDFSYGLWCVLRNIGVGPATDVWSFIKTETFVKGEKSESRPWAFGTLAIGEMTRKVKLSPEQRGNRWFLAAYYRDVHGRDIESIREVSIDKDVEKGILRWNLGPLETRVIPKEEFPK